MRLLMCQGYQSFLTHIGDAFELDLIDINDENIMSTLCDVITDNQITDQELINFTTKVCENCETKKLCGETINVIIASLNMEVPDAIAFIHDVISHDFFLDLEGDLKSFLRCFRNGDGQIKAQLKALLHVSNKVKKKKGSKHTQSSNRSIESDEYQDESDDDDDLDLIDSDEDNEGNLR